MKKYVLFLSLFCLACLVWQCKDEPDEIKPDEPKPRYTTVSTFAGSGTAGSTDGIGTAASFSNPQDIVKDSQGNFFVAERNNNIIRKITSAGVVTTFAGTAGQSGHTDGTGATARFTQPIGICIDASDNLYVSERSGNRVRKITPVGVVTTLAGSTLGTLGDLDATGTNARFFNVMSITIDAQNNLYVIDSGNNKVRKITPSGVVTTIASAVSLNKILLNAQGIMYYISNNAVGTLNLSTGATTVLAGSEATLGFEDATGANARFNRLQGIGIDSEGNLFVTDRDNYRVRKVTSAGVVTTLAGTGTIGLTDGAIATATFNSAGGIYVDKSNNALYISDAGGNKIRKID